MSSGSLHTTVSTVSLKMKFEKVILIRGLYVGWGGLRLYRTVDIARYILTYDVTLLPESQSSF